ncbi:MAG TPA: hypothetical protein VK817_17420 [Trebonia sp.]|nr:hypothetical protein [Trebonia sp.]
MSRALPPETPGCRRPSKKELARAARAATGCGTCGDDVPALATWMAETDRGHEKAVIL